MKIVFSTNTAWNIFNFRLSLAETLKEQGHTVVALAPKDQYADKIKEKGIEFIDVPFDPKGTNVFKDFNLIFRYYKRLKEIKPDIVLSFTIKPNIYGNIAARILKIPTINNISGLGTIFITKSIVSFIGKKLYSIGLSSSNHVFFQNNDDQKLFKKLRIISSEKNSVIPGSGVNLSIFKNNKKRNKGKTFLFSGRLIRDKGVEEYLKAAADILKKFPKKEFLLIGEMGTKNKTAIKEQKIKQYLNKHPQIKYLGRTDNIKNILKKTDVMVLPSYREGLSKSLIEAAAMEIPIITTTVPGCKDVVENNYNGLLCKEKSVEGLYKCIQEMILMPEEKRQKMGLNGRVIAKERFDEKIVINTYLKEINIITG